MVALTGILLFASCLGSFSARFCCCR